MSNCNNNLTLCITTIGNLLLEKTIGRKNEAKPITDVDLKIPLYQRPYKWTARNAIQLLDDIIDAMNSNKEIYRVGTLILNIEKDKPNEYNIVDGQQRLITFSLLLKALGIDNISFLEEDIYDNPHNRFNIPTNYAAFNRRINSGTADNEAERQRRNESIRDYILNQCELIVVINSDISEAFQFFDSQNARGKPLYPHDLLKAYHLREMSDISEAEVERIVKEWECIPQDTLADFFGKYIYRLKEWAKGNRAYTLSEQNIDIFKGINKRARTPYSQFYKAAYSYAEMINSSSMPFVSGTREISTFQLNTPIIAGKPFFEYTNHYFAILKDIQNNNKYEGFYINGNDIVKTLDKYYRQGTGNKITRLLFDTALLLYVDRFCPESFPDKADLAMFEQYVVYAFIWAYSLRAQYTNLGWLSAQNYILGESTDIVNAFNIYKVIIDADTAASLLSTLAEKISPITNLASNDTGIDDLDDNQIYKNFMHYFVANQFYGDK